MTDRIGSFDKKFGHTQTNTEKTPEKPTPRAKGSWPKIGHTRVRSMGLKEVTVSGGPDKAEKPETPRLPTERDRKPDIPQQMGNITKEDMRLDELMLGDDFDH